MALAADPLARRLLGVGLADLEERPHVLQDGRQRHRLRVSLCGHVVGRYAGGSAALRELVAEPALSYARLSDDADHLAPAVDRLLQAPVQFPQLALAPDEPSQARS